YDVGVLTYRFFLHCSLDHCDLHSFPTRRSSDLHGLGAAAGIATSRLVDQIGRETAAHEDVLEPLAAVRRCLPRPRELQVAVQKQDRKSTRLNSSHVAISYAVFCLKKKNKTHTRF